MFVCLCIQVLREYQCANGTNTSTTHMYRAACAYACLFDRMRIPTMEQYADKHVPAVHSICQRVLLQLIVRRVV